jgi:RnfABCDGE-type electron transport complex B subunit
MNQQLAEFLIPVGITFGFAAALAFLLGVLLAIFRKVFEVKRDPFIDKVRAALPGANCGACGYPGCDAYAEAVAAKKAPITACTTGGSATATALGALMGSSADVEDMQAVLRCRGKREVAGNRGDYVGLKSCRAAKISVNSTKLCSWGCMGFGDCVSVCQFGALRIGDEGLPIVDYRKCVGCGKCVEECPQKLFALQPKNRKGAVVLCQNRNPVKPQILKACKVGCIKCEKCVRECPEQCISMENGIPVVDYSKCTSCGTCVSACPTKCFHLLETIRS